MKQQQHQENDSKQNSLNELERLKRDFEKNNLRLSLLEMQKDELYASAEFDIEKLQVLNQEIDRVTNAIAKIRFQQRKLGVIDTENTEVLNDNQTIISTSSVRRKDRFALALPPQNNIG